MKDFRPQTCCFTGHRIIPAGMRDILARRLDVAIDAMIQEGYCYFGAGGALGFDTMAAQSVLRAKEKYPHIRLILVLPCRDQAAKWNIRNRRIYEDILSKSDRKVYMTDVYTEDCMFRRNRRLVECSSACICYLTKTGGGTAYTVREAEQHGLRIVNLA
ncbi:MAG: DUF1273 family protein [Clostridia bacterium]|nr:DUF1273 family protein [Clostridia bacterium]